MELSPDNKFVKAHSKVMDFAENHLFLFSLGVLFSLLAIIGIFSLIAEWFFVEPPKDLLERFKTLS